MVREGEGIAAGILQSLGVSLEKVRQRVMQVVVQPLPSQQSKQQADPVEIGSAYSSTISMHMLTIPRHEFGRLAKIALRLNRSVDDLVIEAIQRVWLTEAGDAQTPPHPPT